VCAEGNTAWGNLGHVLWEEKNDASWANEKIGALTIFPAMRDGLSAGIYKA
jgi:hypothetical protein